MPNDRQYEFVYVLAPTVANSEVEAIQGELDEQIRKLGGSVENTDLWGRRKLAYPIGNFTEGIYVVQLLRGPGEMVTELERRLPREGRRAAVSHRAGRRGPAQGAAGGREAEGGCGAETRPPTAGGTGTATRDGTRGRGGTGGGRTVAAGGGAVRLG